MSEEEKREKKYHVDFSRVFNRNNIRGVTLFYSEDSDIGYQGKYYSEKEMVILAEHIANIMSQDKKVFELFLFAWQLAFNEYPELKRKVESLSSAEGKTVH